MSAYEGDEFDFLNKETVHILEEGMKILKEQGENTDSLKSYYNEQFKAQHDGRDATESLLDAKVEGVVKRIKNEWLKDGKARFGSDDGMHEAVGAYLNSIGYQS